MFKRKKKTDTGQEEPAAKKTPAAPVAVTYDLDIKALLGEAWQKTKGAKGSIWVGIIIIFVVSTLLNLIGTVLSGSLGGIGIIVALIIQLAGSAVSIVLWAGLVMIGIQRASDQPIQYKTTFAYIGAFVPLLIASVLVWVLIAIGFLLLIIPGIYLLIAYMFTFPLIVDKGLSPWQAMETSRKALSKISNWFKVFSLFFIMGLLYMISAIPLFLGVIWTVPMFVVLYGIVYRNIFGAEQAVSAEMDYSTADEMTDDTSGMGAAPEPAEPHTPRVVKSSTGKNSCPMCKTGYMPWITYCPPCQVPLQDL